MSPDVSGLYHMTRVPNKVLVSIEMDNILQSERDHSTNVLMRPWMNNILLASRHV